MKRFFTTTLLLLLTFGWILGQQNGPCTDFDDKAHGSIQNNGTASLMMILDNWSTRCANLQYDTVGSQNGVTDVYLHAYDVGCGNAGSFFYNDIDYTGDWTTFGKCFCYDFRIIFNGNTTPAPPSNLRIYNGTDPLTTTYSASFVLVNPVTPDSGWVTICPPIALANPDGSLPSNEYGQWVLTKGTTAAAWDSLIQDVSGVMYSVDIGASPTEQYGFDNICFTDCPGEEDPCSQLELDAQFRWAYGDSLWKLDLGDMSTVDSMGSIAWIDWCIDSTLISAFPGDRRTITLPGPGTYEVCLKIYGFATDSNGVSICCKDSLCETITVTICDYHNPAIAVTQSPAGSATVTFTDASQNGSRSIWQADTSDASTLYITQGTGTSITHTYPGPGIYTAMLVSWWHYEGVLCCIDTVYTTVIVGQGTDPCDSFRVSMTIDSDTAFQYKITVMAPSLGLPGGTTIVDLTIDGVPTPPEPGGTGASETYLHTFPGPGTYILCAIGQYNSQTSTGQVIRCTDTLCDTLIIPQTPQARCDSHQAVMAIARGRNFAATFFDNSNFGSVSEWYFTSIATLDTTTTGTGSSISSQFTSAGPHRVCLVSVWYPDPNDKDIECRDTVCRVFSFPPQTPSSLSARIVPNPARTMAKVTFDPQPKPVSISLLDLQGAILKQWEAEGSGTAEMKVAELESGVYLLRVSTETQTTYVKWMKE